VDNCPAHPNLSNLKNIEMTFFPGSLKGHYRKKILIVIIELDSNAFINMLDAVSFPRKAWEEVTAETYGIIFVMQDFEVVLPILKKKQNNLRENIIYH